MFCFRLQIMYPQQSFKVSSTNTTTTVNKAIARNESFNSTFDLPVVMVASSSSDRNAMTPNGETAHDEQLTSKENGFSNYSLALIITIGIGCILLTFNVLVFIIVYNKKDNTRSNSDKNSGSIRSISSNNSLIMGLEGGPQSSRKVTENGGPSLNIKSSGGKNPLLLLLLSLFISGNTAPMKKMLKQKIYAF